MSNVTSETANWRLFGGGGVALGGLLLLLAAVVNLLGVAQLGPWLQLLGFLVLAVGFFLVAWGQTGSNGAVGNLLWGKVALWVLAAGFVVLALVNLLGTVGALDLSLGLTLLQVGWVLLAVGSIAAAVAIFTKGVANGLAKYALFAVALVIVLYTIGFLFLVPALLAEWIPLVLSILLLLTGIVYVLNGKFSR